MLQAGIERNPEFHAARLHRMIAELSEQARKEGEAVGEPRAAALFQTTAEVLNGLAAAYRHYLRPAEKALRRAS